MSVHSDQAPSPVAAVVILAAGEGKRMKSSRSKLLHEIAGRSMLSYAVTAATTVQPEHIVVVVGHFRDQVEAHLAEIAPHVLIAVQEEQLGTGDAVQAALGQVADLTGDVIVTMGDVPMLTGETLAALLEEHRARRCRGHRANCTGSRSDGIRTRPARWRRHGDWHRRAPRRG